MLQRGLMVKTSASHDGSTDSNPVTVLRPNHLAMQPTLIKQSASDDMLMALKKWTVEMNWIYVYEAILRPPQK